MPVDGVYERTKNLGAPLCALAIGSVRDVRFMPQVRVFHNIPLWRAAAATTREDN